MSVGVVHLTPAEMQHWASLPEDHPVAVNDRQVRAYAETQGGLTLQYWKLALGRVWGDPFMMTNDEVARRPGVAEADLEQIVTETNAALGWNDPRCGAG